METYERLSRLARSGIERLPVLSAEPLRHWWGRCIYEKGTNFLILRLIGIVLSARCS